MRLELDHYRKLGNYHELKGQSPSGQMDNDIPLLLWILLIGITTADLNLRSNAIVMYIMY